ncbi:MAG TPA: hypothetical protein PKA13_25335 [Geminicoccaceae bacterium]|nr:hypothetical protein [Geminicoccus sp.]HMU53121.1 hypothetical protein [Geminicoccaceae bacterium]
MPAVESDRSRRAWRWSLFCLLLASALAACGGSGPEPGPAPEALPAPAPQPPPELSAAARIDRLCSSLRRIVAAEIKGFAELRGHPSGDRQWQGIETPPSMASCVVEGDFFPAAQYVCRGAQSGRGRPETLDATFFGTADDLDACLRRPEWGGRGWTRGQAFVFAAGERQILWRFGGNVQRPGLSLKIEEDIGRGIWFIRLAAMTLR